MQSYLATITCFIVTTFVPDGLLAPKDYTFYNKTYIECYFVKLSTHFSQTFLIFKTDLTTLVAQQVYVLRTKLWKVLMNSKIVMFLSFAPSKNLHF